MFITILLLFLLLNLLINSLAKIKKTGASNKSSNIESMLLSCQALPYLKNLKAI